VRTVLVRNFNHWDKIEANVEEVVFTADRQRRDARGGAGRPARST
jgi:hypothetical protein